MTLPRPATSLKAVGSLLIKIKNPAASSGGIDPKGLKGFSML
jgi:hypothetical protein